MTRQTQLLQKTDRKWAVLIDPDKHSRDELLDRAAVLMEMQPDYIFIGGSLIYKSSVDEACTILKQTTNIPLVLFPGHFNQLTKHVDAVLLLSLISGRNPELLIGQHVLAAPILKQLQSNVISTGYMLIDGGRPTSVSYMSHTQPIPRDKEDLALCTALAGEYLGMKQVYLDAGSGAKYPVSEKMISAVSEAVSIPLIVGGGISKTETLECAWNAGANLVVVGNALENSSTDLHKEFGRIRNAS